MIPDEIFAMMKKEAIEIADSSSGSWNEMILDGMDFGYNLGIKSSENRVKELEDGLKNLIEGVQEYFDERKSNPNNKNSGVLFKRNSMAFRLAGAKQLLTNKSK